MNGEIPLEAVEREAVAAGRPAGSGREWRWGLVLVGAVFLTYSPVWWAGFTWDDDVHVTGNVCIVGPLGLKEIWTTGAGQFFPLVLTTFWLEHALWGLYPLPYHLVNVLVHAGCAVLLWRVLRSLQVPGAWLGAALWALHPLQVESAAWISELKNTQSCLFYLGAIFFFVKWLEKKGSEGESGGGWNYALMLVFAVLAMLSKTSTLVLPAVLALCAWWVKGRWSWRTPMTLAPPMLLSMPAAILTLWPHPGLAEKYTGPEWTRSWPERIASVGDVIWFYLGKLFWPHRLMAIYPRWQIDAGQWDAYVPLVAALAVLVVFWRKRESWGRPWFFAYAYFLVALSPFLGLIDQSFWRYSFVQDHLQNLAAIGPLALAGAGMSGSADGTISGRRWVRSALCAGLLAILGTMSWDRSWVYANQETFWTDAVARNPGCLTGNENLGKIYLQKGESIAAISQFQRAIESDPVDAEAYYNLGYALARTGQMERAIGEYRRALEIDPNYYQAHNNLGQALMTQGRLDEAMDEYGKTLAINPEDAESHNNLGVALAQKGRLGEATAEFQEAVRLKPNYVDAQSNLAKVQAMERNARGPK